MINSKKCTEGIRMFPDRYQILGHKLDGGMGSVHLCYDQTLERKVAIKVIHNPKMSGESLMRSTLF